MDSFDKGSLTHFIIIVIHGWMDCCFLHKSHPWGGRVVIWNRGCILIPSKENCDQYTKSSMCRDNGYEGFVILQSVTHSPSINSGLDCTVYNIMIWWIQNFDKPEYMQLIKVCLASILCPVDQIKKSEWHHTFFVELLCKGRLICRKILRSL